MREGWVGGRRGATRQARHTSVFLSAPTISNSSSLPSDVSEASATTSFLEMYEAFASSRGRVTIAERRGGEGSEGEAEQVH